MPDVLQNIKAEEIMQDAPVIVNPNNTIEELRGWCRANIERSNYGFFVLADDDETFTGYVQREKLFDEEADETLPVREIMTASAPAVTEDEPANTIGELMGHTGMDMIAALSKVDKIKIAGVITASDIVRVYSDLHRRDRHYHNSISLPRRTLRMIVKGRTLMQSTKREALSKETADR